MVSKAQAERQTWFDYSRGQEGRGRLSEQGNATLHKAEASKRSCADVQKLYWEASEQQPMLLLP